MTTPSPWRAARNERALARLTRALPALFPAPVMAHALFRPFTPPTPRRAVESYWRAHPLRADRLARALITRSGPPAEWVWTLSKGPDDGRPITFRLPPAPYREAASRRGPGQCCVCGQPVFRYGWHRDLWEDGRTNRLATWHAACAAAWKFWCAPSEQGRLLRRVQRRRCAATGDRLLKTAEVDHRVPLHQVWRERRDRPWPELIGYWGLPNLQIVNRAAHAAKTVSEAARRREIGLAQPDA